MWDGVIVYGCILADAPRGVTFVPNYTVYIPGETIQCRADGYPPPTFEWEELNVVNGTIIVGNTLPITSDMLGNSYQYQCTASNVIFGQPYNATRTISFSVEGERIVTLFCLLD